MAAGQPNELNFRLNGVENFNRVEKRDGEVTSSDRVPNNQWTFITCTYDGRQQRIYINGKLSALGDYSAPLQEDASDLFIGIYCNTYEDSNHALSFQGHIADVGIWKAALDAKSISMLYSNGRGKYGGALNRPWDSDFIAGYHLDEGQGTTVADFSGNGNTGRLHGGVTWGRERESVATHPAVQFDGTRYAMLPQPTKFTSGDFTVSLWFNPVAAGKSSWLFMRGLANNDQRGDIGLMINRHTGDLDFEANAGVQSRWIFGWDAPESSLHSAFRPNAWNHVVVTRRGDTYTMWMNGSRVGSQRSSADISDIDNTNPLLLGWMMADSGANRGFRALWTSFASTALLVRQGDSGVYDDAGGSRAPGEAVPIELTPATGISPALQFDGTGYVSIPGQLP